VESGKGEVSFFFMLRNADQSIGSGGWKSTPRLSANQRRAETVPVVLDTTARAANSAVIVRLLEMRL
jgi:hypothetical protein